MKGKWEIRRWQQGRSDGKRQREGVGSRQVRGKSPGIEEKVTSAGAIQGLGNHTFK